MQVYTIGYERTTIAGLVDALVKAQVDTLLDVRQVAWSQRPEFRKTSLCLALREGRIEYLHCKYAGNPFRPSKDLPVDADQCRQQFDAHLHREPLVVQRLVAEAGGRVAALFCYEANRSDCHRGVLIEHMIRAVPTLVAEDLHPTRSPLPRSRARPSPSGQLSLGM